MQKVAAILTLFLTFAILRVAAQGIPDPAQVMADYPDRAHQAAAVEVMLKTINRNGMSKEAADKYSLALGQLDPPSAPDHAAFEKQWWPIADDPQFHYSVVARYLPALAPKTGALLRAKDQEKREKQIEDKMQTAGLLLVAVILGVPLLFLAWPWRVRGRAVKIPDDIAGPLRLPEDLRRVRVFRKSYPIVLDCGQIYDKNEWTETRSYTTTSPGRSYTIGDTTYVEQGTTQTHYTSTKYHRYNINTPDGRQTWFTYGDNAFIANKGNIISSFDSHGNVLIAYNHTTGNYERLDAAFPKLNRYPGRWVWAATIAASGLVVWLLKDYFVADYARELGAPVSWGSNVVNVMIVVAIVSPIYIGLLKWIVQLIRKWQFIWFYESRLKQFLESCTPHLKAMYGPLPEEPDVARAL